MRDVFSFLRRISKRLEMQSQDRRFQFAEAKFASALAMLATRCIIT